MAENQSNKLLKYGVPVALFALVAGTVIIAKKAKQEEISATPDESIVFDLTEEERRDLNLRDGDTPHDTLKTLLSEVKRAKSEMEKTRRENATLKGNSAEIDNRINEAVLARQQELESSFQAQLDAMQRKLESVMNGSEGQANTQTGAGASLPIGLGAEGRNTTAPLNNSGNVDAEGMMWVDPDDMQYKDNQGKVVDATATGAIPSFPNLFKKLDDSIVGKGADDLSGKRKTYQDNLSPQTTPYYTLPENSTLVDAVAMTALIGRVPIGGALTDPFPFKAIIGRENLLANGIELPDVQEAIISGTLSGDWTLSCVRGKVRSMTFIFQDGRIVSLPSSKRGGSQNSDNDEGIGWLSDPQGVTCLPGERKTNAPEYLSTQFFLSGASAAAQGFAQGQTTTVVDGGSVVGAVTGQQGKYILGQGLSGGLNETAQWVRERFGQMFDAIYIPPGKKLAVHITQELAIDYNEGARKVKYNQATNRKRLD